MPMAAREIMTPNQACVRSSDSVMDAAMRMVDLGVGSLPVCGEGEDNTLRDVITDCDIVVKVIAEAHDPRAVHVRELAQDHAVTSGVDDSAEEALAMLRLHHKGEGFHAS